MHNSIISIASELNVRAVTPQPFIKRIVHEQIRQQRTDRSSNDIANNCSMLDRIVPRTQLQTAYGEGWKKP